MDVFERVLQGVLRDSTHGDRLALALPLLARAQRRTDPNAVDPMSSSHGASNPFLPANRRSDGSSNRRTMPPRTLSPLNQSYDDHCGNSRPLSDSTFQPLTTIPQQLQTMSVALPSASKLLERSKLLEHVSLSKLDHTLAAASQQVNDASMCCSSNKTAALSTNHRWTRQLLRWRSPGATSGAPR
jgi:hypothetical protein